MADEIIEALMRRTRLARRLSLKDVAAQTRIDVRMLEHIEQGRFDKLPGGIYARAWTRAYASAIGLDPAKVLAEVQPLLPHVDERLEAIAVVRQRAYGAKSADAWKVPAAAAADAAILCTIDALFVTSSAAACRVTVTRLMEQAWVPFGLLFLILACLYFMIFAGAGGRTLGAMIFGLPGDPVSGPLDLRAAGRRGARCLLAEASLLLGLR